MPKGYWIPHLDVSNPDGFQAYRTKADAWHEHNGSTLLARAGRCELVEGKMRSRNVLRQFSSFDEAQAAYRSPEYSAARPLRAPYAQCDFLIVEGFEGQQPGRIGTPPAAAACKGYWIAHVDVTAPEGYGVYAAALDAPLGAFAGCYLVRGGAQEVTEGKARSRTVVIEFPSYEAAHACYYSPDYQAVKKLRERNAEVDLLIIEGVDGPKF
jgi:uncharacterized protein (DUF1330 family)